jgi:predicted DNA-binding transcriptional regulator AlpA
MGNKRAPASPEIQMLKTKDAAERCGLSPITLSKLRCRGGGPTFLKLGKAVRYAPEAIDAWLATKARLNTSQA